MSNAQGNRFAGVAVAEAMTQDLFPDGATPGYGAEQPPQQDSLASVVAALGIIERHLEPMRPRQMMAAALLSSMGGDYAEIATTWTATRHLQGAVEPLIKALESATMIRTFKGHSMSRQTQPGGAERRPWR